MANGYMRKCPVTHHQVNANQSHAEISFHTCQDDYYQRNKTTKVGKDVEEREPLFTVGGNAKQGSPMEPS